ncbi:MAG: GntR family transcriptional regulator [Lachnospiraceae bacterium]|nr:GntR family transcriptional regulator [Lachnospiraceae bacterium]
MKFNTSMPIYLQVITAIKRDLVTGKMKAGDKLPSGRELATLYEINPNTAARVYSELEQEGITFTRRGLGTYVTEDEALIRRLKEEMAEELVTRFLEEMKELGIPPEDAINMATNALSRKL